MGGPARDIINVMANKANAIIDQIKGGSKIRVYIALANLFPTEEAAIAHEEAVTGFRPVNAPYFDIDPDDFQRVQ